MRQCVKRSIFEETEPEMYRHNNRSICLLHHEFFSLIHYLYVPVVLRFSTIWGSNNVGPTTGFCVALTWRGVCCKTTCRSQVILGIQHFNLHSTVCYHNWKSEFVVMNVYQILTQQTKHCTTTITARIRNGEVASPTLWLGITTHLLMSQSRISSRSICWTPMHLLLISEAEMDNTQCGWEQSILACHSSCKTTPV